MIYYPVSNTTSNNFWNMTGLYWYVQEHQLLVPYYRIEEEYVWDINTSWYNLNNEVSESLSNDFYCQNMETTVYQSNASQLLINQYWMWDTFSPHEHDNDSDLVYKLNNFKTFDDIKHVVRQSNPNATKEDIYDKLLTPFKHDKVKIWSPTQHKFKINYICRYEGCDKTFTKTWNLLDHVRMHEGIKPYKWKLCSKEFTQKGNLKKHNFIQHSNVSLYDRKKFIWSICSRVYTERYNLNVSSKLFECWIKISIFLLKFIREF